MNPRNAPFLRLALNALLTLACGAAPSAAVLALDAGPYSMEILVGGRPLAEHAARNATYVEALEGREYAVRLRNHTGERIAVALAIDGLNSIDARHTGPGAAAKWILGPYETITLEGWQTGVSSARRFFFTTEARSYGAWLGRTDDLGVISAAVFRERRPVPVPIQRPPRRAAAPSRPPQPLEQEQAESRSDSQAPSGLRSQTMGPAAAASEDLAATGIGERLDHEVEQVAFEAEPAPAAVMQVRYEYRDALVRLGVLPEPRARRQTPLDRRERARGFKGLDFAPDPYR